MAKFDLRNKYNSTKNNETHLTEIKIEENFLVDYKSLELNNEDEQVLMSYEKEACNYFQQATKNIYELSRVLYNANKLLSNYKSGTFTLWFEGLGLKRSFVYDCISRYEVLLSYKNVDEAEVTDITVDEDDKEEIMSLPIRVINDIKRLELKSDEIKEVTNSFDYKKTLAEFRERYKQQKKQKECIRDLKFLQKKIDTIMKRKEKICEKIEELEAEFNNLEAEQLQLEQEIENLK